MMPLLLKIKVMNLLVRKYKVYIFVGLYMFGGCFIKYVDV